MAAAATVGIACRRVDSRCIGTSRRSGSVPTTRTGGAAAHAANVQKDLIV